MKIVDLRGLRVRLRSWTVPTSSSARMRSLPAAERLAQARADHPQGPWGLAAPVERIVTWREHYGLEALMSNVTRKAREDVDLAARALCR